MSLHVCAAAWCWRHVHIVWLAVWAGGWCWSNCNVPVCQQPQPTSTTLLYNVGHEFSLLLQSKVLSPADTYRFCGIADNDNDKVMRMMMVMMLLPWHYVTLYHGICMSSSSSSSLLACTTRVCSAKRCQSPSRVGSSEPYQVPQSVWGCRISGHFVQSWAVFQPPPHPPEGVQTASVYIQPFCHLLSDPVTEWIDRIWIVKNTLSINLSMLMSLLLNIAPIYIYCSLGMLSSARWLQAAFLFLMHIMSITADFSSLCFFLSCYAVILLCKSSNVAEDWLLQARYFCLYPVRCVEAPMVTVIGKTGTDTVECAGNGSYGSVTIWLAQHVPSAQMVAIKSVDFDKCELPYSLLQVDVWNCRLTGPLELRMIVWLGWINTFMPGTF